MEWIEQGGAMAAKGGYKKIAPLQGQYKRGLLKPLY